MGLRRTIIGVVVLGFLGSARAQSRSQAITADQLATLRQEIDRAHETQNRLAALPRSTSAAEDVRRNEIEMRQIEYLVSAFQGVHRGLACGSLDTCLTSADRDLLNMTAQYDEARRAAEAAQQASSAQAAQRQAAEAEEARAPTGSTFERMTPHDHFLAAQAAIDMNACADGEDCRDPGLASRHLSAIRGQTRYIETHRRELVALAAAIDTAANQVRELEQNIAARGPEPRPNERGGTYSQVRTYLQTRLDDPRSYQAVRCLHPEPRNDHWTVECSFRSRNRFNALVLQSRVFSFQRGRIIDDEDAD